MTTIRNLIAALVFVLAAVVFTEPAAAQGGYRSCAAQSQTCVVAGGYMTWGAEGYMCVPPGYYVIWWYCIRQYDGVQIGSGICNSGMPCYVGCDPNDPECSA